MVKSDLFWTFPLSFSVKFDGFCDGFWPFSRRKLLAIASLTILSPRGDFLSGHTGAVWPWGYVKSQKWIMRTVPEFPRCDHGVIYRAKSESWEPYQNFPGLKLFLHFKALVFGKYCVKMHCLLSEIRSFEDFCVYLHCVLMDTRHCWLRFSVQLSILVSRM